MISEYGSVMALGAAAAAVLGMIVRGWASIKAALQSFIATFVTTTKIDDEATALAVLSYMVKTYKRSKFSPRTYGGRHESFRDGKFGHVPFERYGDNNITFWDGWNPVIFHIDKLSGSSEDKTIYWGYKPKPPLSASLIFIRGTVDVDAIVKAASAERNEIYWSNGDEQSRRFFIRKVPDCNEDSRAAYTAGTRICWFQEGTYRLLSHKTDELGRHKEFAGRAIDNLFFPDSVKSLIREIELWRDRRHWYAERGIPWKRGWVLYGVPGSGKSALVRAIAEDLDMPLFVFSLGQMLNSELEKSWEQMQAQVPCIALFEDFDNVFHGRDNIYGKPTMSQLVAANAPNNNASQAEQQSLTTGRLTFDCLLNCMDGVDKCGGIFTVITTNHIEKLDPALGLPRKNPDGTVEFISTRPGRIDKAVELGYMTVQDKIRMVRRIFFDNPAGRQKMRKIVYDNPHLEETPAQFQEKCAQVALEMLWQESDNIVSLPRRRNQHKVA